MGERREGAIVPEKGPYIILAAFWSDEDVTDEVAKVVNRRTFPPAKGKPPGAVVSFRREIAESPNFERDLRGFDLDELYDGERDEKCLRARSWYLRPRDWLKCCCGQPTCADVSAKPEPYWLPDDVRASLGR